MQWSGASQRCSGGSSRSGRNNAAGLWIRERWRKGEREKEREKEREGEGERVYLVNNKIICDDWIGCIYLALHALHCLEQLFNLLTLDSDL